jgi:hypothetical protein
VRQMVQSLCGKGKHGEGEREDGGRKERDKIKQLDAQRRSSRAIDGQLIFAGECDVLRSDVVRVPISSAQPRQPSPSHAPLLPLRCPSLSGNWVRLLLPWWAGAQGPWGSICWDPMSCLRLQGGAHGLGLFPGCWRFRGCRRRYTAYSAQENIEGRCHLPSAGGME